jgi:hypothetical protein
MIVQVDPVTQASAEILPLSPRTARAYEIKFLVAEEQARAVETWADRHLVVDPHADPEVGNGYHIHSLYLDTPGLDILHRAEGFKRAKFRVRRYGGEEVIFLERKTRNGDRVRKRRTRVCRTELFVLQSAAPAPSWPGQWFHERVLIRGLQPACRIAYRRSAYVGVNGTDLRLTIDRQLRCAPAAGWALEDFAGGLPLLTGECILELKFQQSMPALFRHLVEQFGLTPRSASKYRMAMTAWGMDGGRREATHA